MNRYDYVNNPFMPMNDWGTDTTNTVPPVIPTPPSPTVLPDYPTVSTPNNFASPIEVRPNTATNYNVGLWEGFKNIFGDGIQKGDFGKAATHGLKWGMGTGPENIPGVGSAIKDYRTDMTAPNRFNTIFGGIQTLGNLWSGIKLTKQAEEQAKFQRNMWNETWKAQKNQINDASAYRAMLRNNGNAEAAQKEYDKTKI